jgi:hypothetical protein
MEMPPLLALDAIDRAIGNFLVGLSVQRHADGKAARCSLPNDLDAGNGLASRPLPNGVKALLSENPVAQSDRPPLRHGAAVKVSRLGWRQLQAKPPMPRLALPALGVTSDAKSAPSDASRPELLFEIVEQFKLRKTKKPPGNAGRFSIVKPIIQLIIHRCRSAVTTIRPGAADCRLRPPAWIRRGRRARKAWDQVPGSG